MKNFCKKHTLIFFVFAIIVALFSNLITGFLQAPFTKNLTISYLIEAIFKCSISIMPITLMVKWGYTKKATKKQVAIGFLLGTLFLLFMAPNLIPLVLVNSNLFDAQWGIILSIVLACFGIGLMEESAIRGVILPLLCEKWRNKKNVYLKAALVSSLLFSCIHLNWSVRYFLEHGTLSFDYFMGNMYQVYYTFCFGLLAAGITIYTRNILAMVFWHSLCDVSAFIIYGILPYASIEFYYRYDKLTLQNVLNTYGVLPGCSFGAQIVLGLINFIFLVVGVILIKKAEKKFPFTS